METRLLRIMQMYILSLMSMCAQSRVTLFGQYVIVTREKLSWRNSGTFNRLRTGDVKLLLISVLRSIYQLSLTLFMRIEACTLI